ncbi:serine protease [Croceicoccus sp. F390]|uniref:Serine protease n=1 Tax=Croceicoccus esteveae TaxID=3075597 RepID=A0ABU2ZEK3_9SPHN|nr:serine protease [Croceicoccus sp. F390]MDT0575034.1 serine protease [Croceicoccus sp. F390]
MPPSSTGAALFALHLRVPGPWLHYAILLVMLAGAGLLASAGLARADSTDINAAARSVVRVVIVQRDASGYDVIGHGTGFAVTPKLIVTNAHVLAPLLQDPGLRLGIVPAQGRTGYFARVVKVASRIDLALVELTEDATLPPATLYARPVDDGSDVFAVGYPANVDQALGLGLDGLTSPQAPVKTRGQVSGGRSSTLYDTILHTAPIGVGNSGGPLLDPCGRVVGVNSFGTISENNSDSEFYFAVSGRELVPFLRAAGVDVAISAQPCRSLAEFALGQDALDLRTEAAAQARLANRAAQQQAEAERARRTAELQAIDNREQMMALAGILLVAMLLSAGGAAMLFERERRELALAAAVFAAVCLGGAIVAWTQRPSIAEVEARGAAAEQAARKAPRDPPLLQTSTQKMLEGGSFVCRLLPDRSRVTVSQTPDVALRWDADGCANGQTQFGDAGGQWSRLKLEEREQAIVIDSYDPQARTFITDRYFVDLPTLEAIRVERARFEAPACGAGELAARELGQQQEAIRALLPVLPNERLVHTCEPEPGLIGNDAPATAAGGFPPAG